MTRGLVLEKTNKDGVNVTAGYFILVQNTAPKYPHFLYLQSALGWVFY